MIIRKAKISDLTEILEIYNYEIQNGVATFDLEPKTPEDRREWFDAHNKDNHPLIVAEYKGHVAGYASLSPYRDKEAFKFTVELSVYISPAYRGMGIATGLMEEILRMARKDEHIHNVVSVITSGNTASVRLHEKFGFKFCGTMPEVGIKFGKNLGIDNYCLIV